MNNGGCRKNNCLRAMQGGGPSATAFCSDLLETGILYADRRSTRRVRRCCRRFRVLVAVLFLTLGGVKKKVVRLIYFEEGDDGEIIEYRE
jgi:hypothetical protein